MYRILRQTTFVLAAILAIPASAAEPLQPRGGEHPTPGYNRLHDYDEIVDAMRAYARAYPEWVSLESIGKSIQGRDLWMITLDNPATGGDLDKPAMYIDGNIHANEVQGAETALYTVDYLLRNYGRLDRVTELLDRVAFYVLPMVNPDGRALWFEGPSTPNFPRTVMVAVDDDRDGQADEDGYDDLDGDGVITQMRKKVPMG
ncbi:MAG TPA: M14 family zinc carboxypeptidase, partial [Thermoanaerobaculia bacterium]